MVRYIVPWWVVPWTRINEVGISKKRGELEERPKLFREDLDQLQPGGMLSKSNLFSIPVQF